jgi:Tol biopolymer transport system component
MRAIDAPGCGEASAPAFSPDGRWIAFACETNGVTYIDLLPVTGGHSRHLVSGWGVFAWSVDSQRIIFAPLNFGLAEININGGKPRNLAFAQDAYEPAIASHGNRLAFVKGVERGEIWRSDNRTGLSRRVFAPSSLEQTAPDISPDGKRIAFEADRSGFHEVWVANLDGNDAVQLSNFRVQLTGTPRWSPDGRQIVFDSRVSGKAALYLVDPGTALPKQVSTGSLPASVPSWSPDGKWIYFTSESSLPSGHIFLYRVSSEGGHPERVTQTLGYNIKQSKDGRFIYFFAGDTDAEIHVVDLVSGQERRLKGMPRIVYPTDWTLGSKGIYFIDWGPKSSIDFFDFVSERVTRKIPLDKQPIMWGGLSLSADESWLMYSQLKQTGSDLMLVEGFR